jgi:hypothetical protein
MPTKMRKPPPLEPPFQVSLTHVIDSTFIALGNESLICQRAAIMEDALALEVWKVPRYRGYHKGEPFYSPVGSCLPHTTLVRICLAGLNIRTVDWVVRRGHLIFSDGYCQAACHWLEELHDYWFLEATGIAPPVKEWEAEIGEEIEKDWPQFTALLRKGRALRTWEQLFRQFLLYLKDKNDHFFGGQSK